MCVRGGSHSLRALLAARERKTERVTVIEREKGGGGRGRAGCPVFTPGPRPPVESQAIPSQLELKDRVSSEIALCATPSPPPC